LHQGFKNAMKLIALKLPMCLRYHLGFWLAVPLTLHAAIQSGIGMLTIQTPSPGMTLCIDFSELRDSCSLLPAACPCTAADVIIPLNVTAIMAGAPYGIHSDTALGAAAVRLYQEKGILLSNPNSIVRLFDSLLQQRFTVARAQGYTDSTPLEKGAYYIRTSEGHFGLIIIFDQSIGTSDNYYYYWAYQDDDSRLLYKGRGPRAKWDSVIVEPHIFSGRVDPRFVIHDSANVAILKLYADSLQTVIDTQGSPTTPNHSWWPGIRVTYCPAPFSSMIYFPLETGRDSVACLFQDNPKMVQDKERAFQRCVIDVLIKEDPVSIMGADTIEAAVLLKNSSYFVGIVPDRHPPGAVPEGRERVFVRSNGKMLSFLCDSPQRTVVETFDASGRNTGIIYNGVMPPGISRIALPQKATPGGVNIIRVKAGDRAFFLRASHLR
jgi:hypothetical protein